MSQYIQSYFSAIPTDLLSLILLCFSFQELPAMLLQLESIQEFDRVFFNSFIWKQLWKRDISSFIPAPSSFNYQKFRDIHREFNICDETNKIKYSVQYGYDILLIPLLSSETLLNNRSDKYNDIMAYAASEGHERIVRMMLDLGANYYNYSMKSAAYGGQMEIVQLMLNLGANNYNSSMIEAAAEGHDSIVQLMLDRGADNHNEAMIEAAAEGHDGIVKMMLDRGANNYNEAMKEAVDGGHINIVKLMLDVGANNYKVSLACAAKRGYNEIVDLIKSYMNQ